MFIGHFAVGFGAKRWAPEVSLGWLIAGAMLLDLLWPVFLLLGWEQVLIDPGNTPVTPLSFLHYPWSHSLVMAVVWGALFAWVYRSRHREAPRRPPPCPPAGTPPFSPLPRYFPLTLWAWFPWGT